MTKLRKGMFSWLNTRGLTFREHVERDTNYLTDYDDTGLRVVEEDTREREGERVEGQEFERGKGTPQSKQPRPFPLNQHFISHPILSEELREEIWRRVTAEKSLSALFQLSSVLR